MSDFILFVQHGWSDTNKDLYRLGEKLTQEKGIIIAPNLGILKTNWRIEPLIKTVAKIAKETIDRYPQKPLRIIGHSMGGLIWLEVLDRHPEWRSIVHSLILMGSPVGGSNIARIIDPLGIGIGMARDLGKNRREIAENIARNIPTLSIASDIGDGTDRMVTVENTKFAYCSFCCLQGIIHPALKWDSRVIPVIQKFWQNPEIALPKDDFATKLIQRVRRLTGMTDGDYQNFSKSQIKIQYPNGITIRTWKNSLGVKYIFIADSHNNCLYAGYVGWLHLSQLHSFLDRISIE